jgi:hypothetical protein
MVFPRREVRGQQSWKEKQLAYDAAYAYADVNVDAEEAEGEWNLPTDCKNGFSAVRWRHVINK